MKIRFLSPADDLTVLTEVIHAAYAKRAADNLRYWATHQTVEDTASRLQSGQAFVAEHEASLIGTITVRPPNANSDVAAYRDPAAWTICQFAVLPEHQGHGVGRQLHAAAEEYAWSQGGRTLALDTAAPAADLIEMYLRWGYSIVDQADWRPLTNYVSIVMSRPIPVRDNSPASPHGAQDCA